MFGFGHLAPKPLTVSAETETLVASFCRNRKRPNLRFPSVSVPKQKAKPNFGRSLNSAESTCTLHFYGGGGS